MDTLKERGVQYISGRIIRENDAVMFDIDDTLIYTACNQLDDKSTR